MCVCNHYYLSAVVSSTMVSYYYLPGILYLDDNIWVTCTYVFGVCGFLIFLIKNFFTYKIFFLMVIFELCQRGVNVGRFLLKKRKKGEKSVLFLCQSLVNISKI